jgi:long-chain acyl-CoA synthetase
MINSLGKLIEEKAQEIPKDIALFFEEKTITFKELDQNVNRLANGLKNLGIKKGDRVAIWLPNTPEFVYSFLACQKIGAVAVPFNTMYKGEEVVHILNDSQATVIIALSNFINILNEIKMRVSTLKYIILTGERDLIFASPDNIVFIQLVCEKEGFSNFKEADMMIGEVFLNTLKKLKVREAWYSPYGALRVKGKKIAGFIFQEIENLYVILGFCNLGKFNPQDFFKVLWVPQEIKDKIIEPLTSVEEEKGERPKVGEFKAIFLKEFAQGLKVEIKSGKLDTRDEKIAYEKYCR